MKILLTNDDGFSSPGIMELKKTLEKKGHEVLILAPKSNQSAKSQCVNIHGRLELTEEDKNVFSLTGTPADTIIFYDSSSLFDYFKIDLVLSGINRGLNVSSDIIYSGTCGAAREASLRGYPAMAISCQLDKDKENCNYKTAAKFLLKHLEEFCKKLKEKNPLNYFLNINVPFNANIENYSYSSFGRIHYKDVVKKVDREDNDRTDFYSIEFVEQKEAKEGDREFVLNPFSSMTDIQAISKDIIALTYVKTFPNFDNS